MVKLTEEAKCLLLELGNYENKYGKAAFGIFIEDNNNHALIVKCGEDLLDFQFNKLSNQEIVAALEEMDGKYLKYCVNMHYYIELTAEGRKLIKRLLSNNY